jgi:cation:H+ antiporter
VLKESLLFAAGLVLLTLGADWLVRGSASLAKQLGVSPLVVGLTVVAFGTSAPELVVSGAAALREQAGLAVGNVMGSTVANVGLIVGVGALLRPIRVHRRLLVRETPLVIFVLTIVMLLSLNDALGRLDGLALITGFLVCMWFLMAWARGERQGRSAHQADTLTDLVATPIPELPAKPARARKEMWVAVAGIAFGLPGLLIGAEWLVDSATLIARAFDIPEAVIGATLVAIGTSLPELASVVVAAMRGTGDIAIGNVIGSNVFNLGLVLGTAALLRPLELPPEIVVRQVLPALAFCVLLIPLSLTRQRVGRWEGLLLLSGYAGFLIWTI